jgi:hypothetical protein
MDKQNQINEQQWQLLVLILREIAIQKLGIGWQLELANRTGFKPSNISRIFSLKYSLSLKNFIIIAKAIEVNFFFEDKDSITDLNQAMERAMDQLGRRVDKLPKN